MHSVNFDARRLLVGVSLLIASACAYASDKAVASPSPTPAAASAATASARVSTRTPIPSMLAGRCSEQPSSSAVIRRYFELSTSSDPSAVSDCFTAQRKAAPDHAVATRIWSTSGPPVYLAIQPLDQALGCDRFHVEAELANGQLLWATRHSVFISVGFQDGRYRIFEFLTGLPSVENATTVCR